MNSNEVEEWAKEYGDVGHKALEMGKLCLVYLFDGRLHVLGVDDQPATSGILPSSTERRREQAKSTGP